MPDVFRALADPTRREILRLLGEGDKTAGEIAERFDMTFPSVSHHLAVLKKAGLVTDEREGQYIRYPLDATVVEDLIARLYGWINPGRGG